MATKLILIRHGQTEWNLKKRYSGFLDVGLNKTGKIQAKRLIGIFKEEKIDKVYTSDRKRAIQTARIIFKKARIEKIPDLREVHFGVFEGLTYKEIMAKYPVIYKKWLKDPFSVRPPKGEHIQDFKKRIVTALHRIVKLNKNKTVAVFTHGGAISIYMGHLLKSGKFWEQIPQSASVSILEFKGKKPKIKLFNGVSHLK